MHEPFIRSQETTDDARKSKVIENGGYILDRQDLPAHLNHRLHYYGFIRIQAEDGLMLFLDMVDEID